MARIRDDVAERVARPAPTAADLLEFATGDRYSPDFAFYKGGTLLHAIARSPDARGDDIVRILEAACARGFEIRPDAPAAHLPDGRAGDAESALHTALRHRRLQAARMLLHYGADPRLRDGRGRSPLSIAREQLDAEVGGLGRARERGASDEVCARRAAQVDRVVELLDAMRGEEARLAAAEQAGASGSATRGDALRSGLRELERDIEAGAPKPIVIEKLRRLRAQVEAGDEPRAA